MLMINLALNSLQRKLKIASCRWGGKWKREMSSALKPLHCKGRKKDYNATLLSPIPTFSEGMSSCNTCSTTYGVVLASILLKVPSCSASISGETSLHLTNNATYDYCYPQTVTLLYKNTTTYYRQRCHWFQ